MNPYDILGISPEASPSQIKEAYRRAVKAHHPDVAGGADPDRIKLINAAYALLSDPERKMQYDRRLHESMFEMVEEQGEDPRKQEFIRKRKEAGRIYAERRAKTYGVLRKINFVILLITGVMLVDEYFPPIELNQSLRNAWTVGRGKNRKRYTLYFQTDKYTVAVPTGVPVRKDPRLNDPVKLRISPVFRVPVWVDAEIGGEAVSFEPAFTVYSVKLPFREIVFVLCGVLLLFRSPNAMSYEFSFAPILVFVFMLIVIFLS